MFIQIATVVLSVFCNSYGLCFVVGLGIVWCWINRPLNRIKRLGEVGYVRPANGSSGRVFAKQAQRTRRIGEIPPVYPNGWYCVAESDSLAVSQVRPVAIFGTQLALLRDTDGQVHVTDAYCPHLGVNLAAGGKVVDKNCVQCPMHGWSFSAVDGTCVSVPYSETSVSKLPDKARLKTWHSVERNRHIYVWYHCDNIEPTWDIPRIDEVESGEWRYAGRLEHEINCHIEDLPENGADIAHLGHLHKHAVVYGNNIERIDLDNHSPVAKHDWTADWRQMEHPNEHIGLMKLTHDMSLWTHRLEIANVKMKAQQIGPAIVYMIFDFGIFGRGATIHHVTPEEPLFQRSRFVLYSSWRMPQIVGNLFLLSESSQFERDIYVWNNKTYAKQPCLVKEDNAILRHRRWYQQFYSENSPRLLPSGRVSNPPGGEDLMDW